MITSSEYRKRLSKMRRNIYMDGELIDRDHPQLGGAVSILAAGIPVKEKYSFDRFGVMPGER